MNPIEFVAAADADSALRAIGGDADAHLAKSKVIAGGTNLIDLMKEGVMRPRVLVDINQLPFDSVTDSEGGGLLLGALMRNADTAYHPRVRSDYPLLSAAILAGASPQIRNMASNGGNLLQRTRCHYFYDVGTPCNKREPGSGCSAIGGITRQHAILGASDQCIATHPSDMCVALAALGARVHISSMAGRRVIDFADFHRLPGAYPQYDNSLSGDDLITHIELPPARQFAAHSAYLKFRDRASYAFALVSVAAALDIDAAGRIKEARIALGGVAHKPWRVPAAEYGLVGKVPAHEHFVRAAKVLLDGAAGQGGNDFKIPMAHRAVVRALAQAASGTLDFIHPQGGERP